MGDEMMADDVVEIDEEQTRWAPPEGVLRHSGDPIEPNADFFAEPPPEIGELLSADSNLPVGKRPWRTSSRVVLVGLILWGSYMASGVMNIGAGPADQDVVRWGVIGVGVAGALVAWFVTRFSYNCSFVGKLGIARFLCKGNRKNVGAPEVFLFEQATELRTSQTRHYHNGIYTGTAYAFNWTDGDGKKVFKLSGTYQSEKKPPKAKDAFHYASMAEGAWSAYLFDQVVSTLNDAGAVRFNLHGKHFVAIGPGFLDVFTSGSEVVRLAADEIGGMQLDSGQVKIKRLDAQEGWFSSTGVYKFSYESIANSRLFLLLYAHLIGK